MEEIRAYPNWRRHKFLDGRDPLECDVVVVGAGGAGAAAAIEATERGASVLVLEKMPTPGGNTAQSGGSIRFVVDRGGMAEHFWHLCQGATPRVVVDAFVDVLAELPAWIASRGGVIVPSETTGAAVTNSVIFPASRAPTYPEYPRADALTTRFTLEEVEEGQGPGAALWDFLARNLAEREVPVVLGAPVVALVDDGPGRGVTGVVVGGDGGETYVTARRGVILCSGGFAYDRQMMLQSLGIALPSVSAPGRATGDGVRLAQSVGADLWHLGAVAASVGYQTPDFPAAFYCDVPDFGFLVVDQLGRRYSCETALENHSAIHAMTVLDAATGRFLRTPSYLVIDDETRRSGRLVRLPNGENRHYAWSHDNSAEVARGWISTGESLGELARVLGLPADALNTEVRDFNRCAESGSTDRFGRPAEAMRPIARPPFFGVAIYPVAINTQGGPRRNERGQILRPDGTAVPGLYGAGELGSLWNRLYPGTGNVSECLASGLIAARDLVSPTG